MRHLIIITIFICSISGCKRKTDLSKAEWETIPNGFILETSATELVISKGDIFDEVEKNNNILLEHNSEELYSEPVNTLRLTKQQEALLLMEIQRQQQLNLERSQREIEYKLQQWRTQRQLERIADALEDIASDDYFDNF